jgi:hypothetical protein
MSGPAPPNPQTGIAEGEQVAGAQQGINTQVADQQQGINTQIANQQQGFNVASQAGSQYDQTNPYGSLTYTQTGTGPNGVPIYSSSDTLSNPEQGLLNTLQGTQKTAGTGAGSLLAGANYGAQSPSAVVGNMTTGLTNQVLGSEVNSLEPYFNIQNEQEQAQLAAQGITPTGNPTAYNNAMLPFETGQNATVSNFLANAEPQAFNQAQTEYTTPASLATTLGNFGSPTTPNASLVNSPALSNTTVAPTTVTPTNLTQAVSTETDANTQQFQAQQAQYNAMMQGLFGIGSVGLGGLLSGGLTGGGFMGMGGSPSLQQGGTFEGNIATTANPYNFGSGNYGAGG